MFKSGKKSGGIVAIGGVVELPVVASVVAFLMVPMGGGLGKIKLHSGQDTCSPGDAKLRVIAREQWGQLKLDMVYACTNSLYGCNAKPISYLVLAMSLPIAP